MADQKSTPPNAPGRSRPSAGRLRAFESPIEFGPYFLEARLATGGHAEVFVARPKVGQSPAPRLVIKRLLPTLRTSPAARARFAAEGELHRRFSHPNIVRCFGASEVVVPEGRGARGDGGTEPYLAMELVEGADLHQVLALVRTRKQPILPGIAVHIARELLAGLAELHRAHGDDGAPLEIVHGDVTPSNVYLSNHGDVKLGDFGIADKQGPSSSISAASKPSGPTSTRTLRGKHAYLAPEQVAGDVVDARADLFALANVLTEMLVGRRVFAGGGELSVLLAIRDVRTDAFDPGPTRMSTPLRSVLQRALSRSPTDRFPDADALAEALAPFTEPSRAEARAAIAALVTRSQQTPIDPHALPLGVDDTAPPTTTPRRGARIGALTPDPDATMPAPDSAAATVQFTPPPSFIRTHDGHTLGPFAYAKLIELVATGRVDPEDHVDFMGAGFEPVMEIEDLARHLEPRSSTTIRIAPPGAPDWRGPACDAWDEAAGVSIDPGVARALAFVASQRSTGVLIAQGAAPGAKTRRKELYFVNGRLFYVPSSEPGELLGEYLVGKKILDRADLDFALAVLPRFAGKLGEALTGLGLLPPVTLIRALSDQGRDKVVDLFAWRDGELSFYGDAQPARPDFPLDLPVGLLVEAGVAALVDDRAATVRYRPWLDRAIKIVEVPLGLLDAGWSPRVRRALALARAPIAMRQLLRTIALEGSSPHDAARAVESARMVRMLDWA